MPFWVRAPLQLDSAAAARPRAKRGGTLYIIAVPSSTALSVRSTQHQQASSRPRKQGAVEARGERIRGELAWDPLLGMVVRLRGRTTPPLLSRFELSAWVSYRSQQLSQGAEPRIELNGESEAMQIALEEYRQGQVDELIRRVLPDDTSETWRVTDLQPHPLLRPWCCVRRLPSCQHRNRLLSSR